MKTLITQVGTYITSDAIADAVAHYWLALAEEGRADIVEIPIVSPTGTESLARLTLGTMSPIAVVEADARPAINDDGAADQLLTRARALTPAARPDMRRDQTSQGPGWEDYAQFDSA